MLPETAMLLQCPEPWNCDSCGELMYNRDAQGYPCPGAPMPHFWDISHPQVCSACYAMVIPLSGKAYWKVLHDEDREAQARRKDQNDRLSGRRDYFTGA